MSLTCDACGNTMETPHLIRHVETERKHAAYGGLNNSWHTGMETPTKTGACKSRPTCLRDCSCDLLIVIANARCIENWCRESWKKVHLEWK